MKTVKRVTAALMAAIIIIATTYEAYTVPVQATEVVIGSVVGDLLADFLLSLGVTYVGYECFDRLTESGVETSLHSYINTTEGSSALKGCYGSFKVIDGGGGSDPEPPEDPNEILDTKVVGLAISKQLFDFAAGFYDYITDSETESVVGAAINEASNQDITYLPFPECFHFSSVDNPVYNPESVELFQAKYSQFSLEGNSFVQIYTPFSYDTFIVCSPDVSAYLYFRIDRQVVYYGANTGIYGSGSGSGVSVYNFMRNLQTDELGFRIRSGSYTAYGDLSEIYICGNVSFPYRNATYVLNPDGSIYQVVDGEASLQVKPHLETAEGYLTSVKPIVGTNISGLIDAIGKAIADAYPDQAPVLTPEAINEIYNNVSNVYDNAVSNYYNDTSYIDQSQYITNITNVYEQAIADNPAVDNPAIPDSPALGSINDYKAVGLSDVFPFCIPFDMYDLMTLLAAEPKAISFDYTFYMGEEIGEYTYTVDLSVFDPVARVLRTMELMLYMFGLMLVTRSLIRG